VILHIARDEKFIDGGLAYFDAFFPGRNKLVLLQTQKEQSRKFVKYANAASVFFASRKEALFWVRSIAPSDFIVMHGMDPLQALLVNMLPKTQKVLWINLGFEIYNQLGEFRADLWGEHTRAIQPKQISELSRVWHWRMNAWLGRFAKAPTTLQGVYRAMFRAQWVGNFIKEDWDCICQRIAFPNQRIWMLYNDIDETIGKDLLEQYCQGSNIWLGNSATPENNHLEALARLAEFPLGTSKVICPLSYGNASYAERCSAAAEKILPGRMQILREFMDRNDYNRLMLSCPVVIMNHWRQQAVGNVLTALWLGARVYMSEKSTVYRHFANLGILIFTVEKDLQVNNPHALQALSSEERIHNQNILLAEYSHARVLERMGSELLRVVGSNP